MRDRTTELILRLDSGDREAAAELLPLVYDELRAIASDCFRHQPAGITLQPTALVHEAFLKLADADRLLVRDRSHFVAVAAKAMRQILVDEARRRNRQKRGGGWERVSLDQPGSGSGLAPLDVLALNDAIEHLAQIDQRQSRVVELRFFGGLSVELVAALLGVSTRTVELDWRMARAWLSKALGEAQSLSE